MSKKRMADHEHCMYFVARKKRYCRMTVRAGRRYCGEHQQDAGDPDIATDDKRVKCPLDPTHTCYQSKLAKHLTVCNAKRRIDTKPAFIVEGINRDTEDMVVPTHVPLSRLDESVVEAVIRKINSAYEKLPEFSQAVLQHAVLKDKLSDETYGSRVRKHLLQNASLLGHIEQAGLVQDDTCFIEFGAGKAQLAYWLGQIIKSNSNSCVLLVDRSSHRHKNDNKLKKEEHSLAIKRLRVDIADLKLNQITEIQSTKHKVGIAKHLCGTATGIVHLRNLPEASLSYNQRRDSFPDLTIRCLMKSMNSEPRVDVRGLVVAFCCHHRCEYSSYVGREYLQQCGFTTDEFPILCSIVSWATCGSRPRSDETMSHQRCEKSDAVQISQLSEREFIGRKAKTLLNWGRLVFLQSAGFQAELFYYTSTDISLENMCIVATRKHST